MPARWPLWTRLHQVRCARLSHPLPGRSLLCRLPISYLRPLLTSLICTCYRSIPHWPLITLWMFSAATLSHSFPFPSGPTSILASDALSSTSSFPHPPCTSLVPASSPYVPHSQILPSDMSMSVIKNATSYLCAQTTATHENQCPPSLPIQSSTCTTLCLLGRSSFKRKFKTSNQYSSSDINTHRGHPQVPGIFTLPSWSTMLWDNLQMVIFTLCHLPGVNLTTLNWPGHDRRSNSPRKTRTRTRVLGSTLWLALQYSRLDIGV